MDFSRADSYLHVFMNGNEELKGALITNMEDFYPVQAFAHYTGKEKEQIRKRFGRVHECFCFDKKF
jgi:hypothetical protein